MAYMIETSIHLYSPYSEDGDWLDGDTRTINVSTPTPYVFDEYDAEEHGTPVNWAVHILRKEGMNESSAYPVDDAIGPHAWLSETYQDPYTDELQETSARLTGEWTDMERAEVFRRTLAR